MNQASNISMSISLVRQELESTLQKAESYFAAYAEDHEQSRLKLFADELNLARGTFKLLEMSGPETLTTEMLSLIGDGAVKMELKIEALGNAIIGLTQYIDFLFEREKDHPILLIPMINMVRKAGGHRALPESHFFSVNLRPKLPAIDKSNIEIKPHLARLRLIYQAGLLRILKGDDPTVGYKLIDRGVTLLERGFRGTMAWSFWWSCKGAIEAMILDDYELTAARRVMFARVDQLMRQMIKDGPKIFTEKIANELQKDLLHVVSLSTSKSEVLDGIRACYKLSSELTEETLKLERSLLAGPDVNAYESLSKALKDEISAVKSALDSAAKDALSEDGFTEVDDRLSIMIGVLNVINQIPLADKVKEQQSGVAELKSANVEVKGAALAKLADALLQVELACDQFSKGIVAGEDNIIGAGHYIEARIVLLDEIQSGLAMAKRSMGSFVETQDKIHLSNIDPALQGVRGALIFLSEIKASEVIFAAADYLNKKVLNSDQPADEARLEVLADALSSIEYYSETLAHKGSTGSDILQLAFKSIGQLGFKIK